jgi:hypothetical protein
MHDTIRHRLHQAILRLICEFPDLLGPVGIQAALKTVFGFTPEEAARAGQYLTLLETRGFVSHQDLGRGCFVYHSSKAASGPRTQRRVNPRRVPGESDNRHGASSSLETASR